MNQDIKEMDFKKLEDILKNTSDMRFGIGVHSVGLRHEEIEDREKVANAIMTEGLRLGHGYHSILGNVQSLGRNFDLSNSVIQGFIIEDIQKRTGIEHSGKECKVIVAIPTILQNDNNGETKRLALGFPDRSIHSGSKAYEVTSFIDAVCERMGQIPKEFILGYITDGKSTITINPDFYSFLDKDKKKTLFTTIESNFGELKGLSDKILDSNESESVINALSRFGYSNPRKMVESILEERDRLDGKIGSKENEIDDKDETSQGKESFERKLGKFEIATEKRGKIFTYFDVKTAKENKRGIRRNICIIQFRGYFTYR